MAHRPVAPNGTQPDQIRYPAEQVREIPKGDKFDAKTIYYIKGNRDGSKAKLLQEKRAAFVGGQSVTVTEDELNTHAPAAPAAHAGAPKADSKAPAAPAGDGMLNPGPLNVRLHDGRMQLSVPVVLNVLGLSTEVIVQSDGRFVKEADGFVYQPDTFYAGSCPLQRLPMAAGLVREKILLAQPIPDDIKAAWAKLANVSIEGNALKLTMP